MDRPLYLARPRKPPDIVGDDLDDMVEDLETVSKTHGMQEEATEQVDSSAMQKDPPLEESNDTQDIASHIPEE